MKSKQSKNNTIIASKRNFNLQYCSQTISNQNIKELLNDRNDHSLILIPRFKTSKESLEKRNQKEKTETKIIPINSFTHLKECQKNIKENDTSNATIEDEENIQSKEIRESFMNQKNHKTLNIYQESNFVSLNGEKKLNYLSRN